LVLNCLVSVNGVTSGVTTSDTLIIGSCFGKVKDGLPPIGGGGPYLLPQGLPPRGFKSPPYGLFRVFRVSENG
jgi:hypothetical protein